MLSFFFKILWPVAFTTCVSFKKKKTYTPMWDNQTLRVNVLAPLGCNAGERFIDEVGTEP